MRVPGAPIVLDDFTGRTDGCTYFLSHAHADHFPGLSDQWDLGHIHCTDATKLFMQLKFPGLDARRLVSHALEEPFSLLVGPAEDVEVRVTFIDAHHCVGSAIIVLDSFFGRLVYTGDFRLNEAYHLRHKVWLDDRDDDDPDSPQRPARSHRARGQPLPLPLRATREPRRIVVDHLVLDNTHASLPGSPPPREVLLPLICELAALYPPQAVFHVGLETVGKEEVLVALARTLATKVLVSAHRYDFLLKLADPAFPIGLFVHRPEDAYVA